MTTLLLRRVSLCSRHLFLSRISSQIAQSSLFSSTPRRKTISKRFCPRIKTLSRSEAVERELSFWLHGNHDHNVDTDYDTDDDDCGAETPGYRHDLQRMLDDYFKGDARVLRSIVKEILFRRQMRMIARCNAHKSKIEFGFFTFRKYEKHVYNALRKGANLIPDKDAGKWKEMCREYRPSGYYLLNGMFRRMLVLAAAELGDMCERGELTGEGAYNLVKIIGEEICKDSTPYELIFVW